MGQGTSGLLRVPRRVRIALLIIVSVSAIVGGWVWLQWQPPSPPPGLPLGYAPDRAVWVGIEWAMEPSTDASVAALARDFQQHCITDAYFYVSYLNADDVFNSTYGYAQEFVRRMRLYAPDVRLWAWVGVPIQITLPDGEWVENRLQDAAVQRQIAAFAGRLAEEMDFDGIHLNAEPISSGDEAYLDTLRAIRAELPPDAQLSIAPHALRLSSSVVSIPYPVIDHHWTPDYLRRAASEVDQVAIMLYDSGLFLPTDYRAWVAYQTETIASALVDVDVHVLLGLPASEEWTPSHYPAVESLANGLHGFRVGVSRTAAHAAVDGIAIYPYWEIDADKWMLMDALPMSYVSQ